ncbi:hypothetical protein DB346_22285 [Verrucomicrobia bacterium LW23]|nr:hypothetical protein DB346_22285 [Verrucomicrobia bacterium LW23]
MMGGAIRIGSGSKAIRRSGRGVVERRGRLWGVPELFPGEIGCEDAKLGDVVCVVGEPGGAGDFESGVEEVFVSAFDEAGSDGQVVGDGLGVVQVVAAVVEVAPGGAHGGVGNGAGFAVWGQGGQGRDRRGQS